MSRPLVSFLVVFIAALCITIDATTIAVVELGTGGVVHRTNSISSTTSVTGVHSFWKSMHQFDSDKKKYRRSVSIQSPGMSVSPDIFKSADGGIVVGITGNDFDPASMPTVAGALEESGAVGHCHVNGKHSESLLKNINSEVVSSDFFEDSMTKTSTTLLSSDTNKLASILVRIDDSDDAVIVDSVVTKIVKLIKKEALDSGKTIVIYLVVDEREYASHRGLVSRELSEDNEDEEDEEENEEQNNENNNQGQNVQGQDLYGYFNADGEWVSIYKTIFQIQYFNVVLWTSVGLAIVIILSTTMMMYMPLLPDTLLFGESAKMIGE